MAFKGRYYSSTSSKDRGHHNSSAFLLPPNAKFGFYFFLLLFSLWFLLISCIPSNGSNRSASSPTNATAVKSLFAHHRSDAGDDDPSSPSSSSKCPDDIARFYVYDLPRKFNLALLDRCRTLNIYTDMCPHVSNRGLGLPIPRASDDERRRRHGSWYATHQFIAEMIFHARAERHPCRSWDPDEAELFYVPFYGGLHASSNFREPVAERDRLAVEFASHMVIQPAWLQRGGGDHFLALGRTAWDFMRNDDDGNSPDFGANRLLHLPAVANMTVLTVERQPWEGRNQFGIPYPSYFHPHAAVEVLTWQEEVRRATRTNLFAFVGGPRKGVGKAAMRAAILRQCGASSRCRRVECEPGSSRCHDPDQVLEVMMGAEFCMQPPGDSFTRRSVFDAVLAGCVPVFFSEHTAYTQYGWYLPAEAAEYSVFLAGEDKWGRIEEELAKIPKEEVRRLRSRLIGLIPRITYAHPNASYLGFRDAVDVALARLTKHVRNKFFDEKRRE